MVGGARLPPPCPARPPLRPPPPLAARAAERVIGWISPESREATAPFFAALKAGLQANMPPGGETVRVIDRYVVGGPEALPAGHRAAAARCQPDCDPGGATPAVVRAKLSVPVVFAFSGDPSSPGSRLPWPARAATPPASASCRSSSIPSASISCAPRCPSAARWRCCPTPAIPAKKTTSPPASVPSRGWASISPSIAARPPPRRRPRSPRRSMAGPRRCSCCRARPWCSRPRQSQASASPARCPSSRAGRASPVPADC